MTIKPTVEPEYDADTCLLAGELRDMGVENIPDDIPDCAWVPWSAVEVGIGDCKCSGSRIEWSMTYSFNAPWRWFEGKVYERDTNGTN